MTPEEAVKHLLDNDVKLTGIDELTVLNTVKAAIASERRRCTIAALQWIERSPWSISRRSNMGQSLIDAIGNTSGLEVEE